MQITFEEDCVVPVNILFLEDNLGPLEKMISNVKTPAIRDELFENLRRSILAASNDKIHVRFSE